MLLCRRKMGPHFGEAEDPTLTNTKQIFLFESCNQYGQIDFNYFEAELYIFEIDQSYVCRYVYVLTEIICIEAMKGTLCQATSNTMGVVVKKIMEY